MSGDKKYVIITGCSQDTGIGIALAKELIGKGYTVFATARSKSRLSSAIALGCLPLELDVTDPASIRAAVKEVSEVTGGRLQCLINNAGALGRGMTLDADLAKYRHIFDVNFFGPLAMSQAFAPLLLRTSEQDKGKKGFVKPLIMNVGSICETGSPHVSAYSTSKAALHTLSIAMRVEMAGLGVEVIHITLGAVRGPFSIEEDTWTNMDLDAPGGTPSANVRDAHDLIYRDCREAVFKAGMDITKEYHEKSKDTTESVAPDLANVVYKAGPPVVHLAYSSWATKWIVPLLPYKTFHDSMIKIGGLLLVKPNRGAGDKLNDHK